MAAVVIMAVSYINSGIYISSPVDTLYQQWFMSISALVPGGNVVFLHETVRFDT